MSCPKVAEPELERPLVDKPPAARASNGRLVGTGGSLGARKAQEGPGLPLCTPPQACWSCHHGARPTEGARPVPHSSASRRSGSLPQSW